MQLTEIYPKNNTSPIYPLMYAIFLACTSNARFQKPNCIHHSHQNTLSHLQNHQDTMQQSQQQHHHKRYPLINCFGCQSNLQQCGEREYHPTHHFAILRMPTPSSTTKDVHPTLPIISRYCLGSRRSDMKKKKASSLLYKKDTPEIPHNAGGRIQAMDGGLITGWMNNSKRGAPLKITPTNKKMKEKGKSPTKAAAASTDTTKKHPATKPPPITMPPPRTSGRKYTSCKHEPAKSALAHAVEAKIKVLDTQLSAGDIIIPDGTLQYYVRYAKEKAKKRGVSLIVYLKDFTRGGKIMLTNELDRVYIQQLITLRDLKNNGMSRMEFIGVIQKMTRASFEKSEQHWYYCRRANFFLS